MERALKGPAYDEVFTNRVARSHYRGTWIRYQKTRAVERSSVARALKSLFHDDASVSLFPHILRRRDVAKLRRGVAQRARALRAFLHDHYVGTQTYRKAGIIGSRTLRRIIERNDETAAFRYRKRDVQFWYAPDIIRGPDGYFYVLEDNVGFTGGLGDLAALHAAAKLLPIPTSLKRAQPDPMAVYHAMIGRSRGSRSVAMLSYDASLTTTHEDLRFEQACQASRLIMLRGLHRHSRKQDFFVVEDGKLFSKKTRARSRRRIDYLILNIEATDVEPNHPSVRRRFEAQRVPAQDSRGISGFWSAVEAGTVGCNTRPGFEFVNDKEFYAYVENLIRFYLGEEPILRSIPTQVLTRRRIERIFSQIDGWVLKGAIGRGGKQVWLGNRLNSVQKSKLRKRVNEKPAAYIAQPFVSPSVVLDQQVDLRYYALVDSRRVFVSSSAWGRSSPLAGNGKMNISQDGRLSVVLRAE